MKTRDPPLEKSTVYALLIWLDTPINLVNRPKILHTSTIRAEHPTQTSHVLCSLYQISCDANTEIIASANSNEKLVLVDPSVRFLVAQFIHTILFKATTSGNFYYKSNGFNKLWN